MAGVTSVVAGWRPTLRGARLAYLGMMIEREATSAR